MKKLITKRVVVFSSIFLTIALIAGISQSFWPNDIIDKIGTVALACCTLPFLVNQVTFTAGVTGPFINKGVPKIVGQISYMLLFPFFNMIFFAGISAIFNIYPRNEIINGVSVRNEYTAERWMCLLAIYGTLIAIGLIWRYFRAKKISIA